MNASAQWRRHALLLALVALLAGCAAAPLPAPGAAPQPPVEVAPERWLGGEAAELLAAVPPAPAAPPAAPPAPADLALVERWREPAAAWGEVERRASAAEQLEAPRAAARAALLRVAVGHGLAAAALARAAGLEVSEHAVVAEAASRVLAHSHDPERPDRA